MTRVAELSGSSPQGSLSRRPPAPMAKTPLCKTDELNTSPSSSSDPQGPPGLPPSAMQTPRTPFPSAPSGPGGGAVGDPASDPHTPSPQAGPTPVLESPPVSLTMAHRTLPEGTVLGVGRVFSSGTVMEHSVTPSVRTSHERKRLHRRVPRGPPPPPQVTETQNWCWDHRVPAGGASVRNLPFDKRSPKSEREDLCLASPPEFSAPAPRPPSAFPSTGGTHVSVPGRHSTRVQPSSSPVSQLP